MKKTAKKTKKTVNQTPDQTAGTLPDFDGITPPAAGDLPFMDAGDNPEPWDKIEPWDVEPWDNPEPWDVEPWDKIEPWDDADDTPPETYPQTPTATPETPTNSNGDDEPDTDKDLMQP